MKDANIDTVFALSIPISKMNVEENTAPEIVSWIAAQEKRDSQGLEKVIEMMDIYQKPVIICDIPPSMQRSGLYYQLKEENIPTFPSIDRAVKVISRLAWYGQYLRQVKT